MRSTARSDTARCGQADRVGDPLGGGAAVGHDRDSAQAEQDRPADRVRIHRSAQPAEGGAQQQTPRGGERAGARGGANRIRHRPRGPLQGLQGDVPGEAVGDDHVGLPAQQVPTLDVADEADSLSLGQSLMRRDHVLAPLLLLLADGEQRNPRALGAQNGGAEGRPEERELDQVLRAHVGVRAAVEEDQRRAVGAGHGDLHRERRPVDALGALESEEGGGHRRAGRAGARPGSCSAPRRLPRRRGRPRRRASSAPPRPAPPRCRSTRWSSRARLHP